MPSSPALPARVGFPDRVLGAACPACSAPGARTVYSVDGVPTQSCVLIDAADEARKFPRGDVLLAVCETCGFLFNAAFDPSRIDYREGYEETQGHSQTFSSWLGGVVGGLVNEHGLRHATVVEIGCGKGEFLEQLCRTGENRGIGIDPSSTAGRVDASSGLGLRFLHEEYAAHHADLAADAVVCRHTLEHLPRPQEFAQLLRSNLNGSDTLVLIEVPDVGRVLESGAFWDIYYEHCSYFTLGSMARLFRGAGFALLELASHYGDQYLQLLARPLPSRATASSPVDQEQDLARVVQGVETFRNSCRETLGRWNQTLSEALERGERVVLWGSGSKATGLLSTLGLECVEGGVEHVVDINPDKHGKFVAGTGQEIIAPGRLVELQPDRVLVMNPVYQTEIKRDLEQLGLKPRIEAL